MQCLAEGAANSACTSRYDDGFARDLHVSDRVIVVAATSQRPRVLARPCASSTHLFFSHEMVGQFTKQLQAFSELPEPPQEREDTAAGIGETDEIPVKLALEVGKRRPDRFSGGVSVIARVIAGLADGIYPGRAHAEALIS